MRAPRTAPAPGVGGWNPPRRAGTPLRNLLALRFVPLMQTSMRQPLSFWFAVMYTFIEYVRPQAIYPSLQFLPWGKIFLLGGLVACVAEGRVRFRERGIWLLVAGFSLVIVASSFAAQYPDKAFSELNVWVSWTIAMVLIVSATDTKAKYVILMLAFILYNFKMSNHAMRSWASVGFGWRNWGVNGAPGYFQNSGEFGIEMCVFFPITLYFAIGLWPSLTKWRRIGLLGAAATAILGMVASASRGAVLGGGAILFWIMLRSKHRVRAAIVVCVMGASMWAIMPAENKARWTTAGNDNTSRGRIQYWKDGIEIANQYPILGVGYNNWVTYYQAHYKADGELPHNIFIECVAQLGYLGLAVFVGMITMTFVQNARTRRLTGPHARAPDRFAFYMSYGLDGALIGFLTSGFFITVLFYPYFWINLAFTMALSGYVATARASQGANVPRRR